MDGVLGIPDFPDYPGAVNGLQVERRGGVGRILAAVDASEATIREAVNRQGDLLLVHHGLFWGGAAPVTGRRYRKLGEIIRNDLGVYAAHLPLDAHAEIGNSAVLARELDIPIEGAFGHFEGREVGWWGRADEPVAALRDRVAAVTGGPVRLIPGGGEGAGRVGVLTGGGGSFIGEAAALGLDTLLTGEGAHHTYFDAMELGVNVLYAGHYATETWGVKALAALVADHFGLAWDFIDLPTGL
jgi:dinuclear metal center YbgI/SA1388 family protein